MHFLIIQILNIFYYICHKNYTRRRNALDPDSQFFYYICHRNYTRMSALDIRHWGARKNGDRSRTHDPNLRSPPLWRHCDWWWPSHLHVQSHRGPIARDHLVYGQKGDSKRPWLPYGIHNRGLCDSGPLFTKKTPSYGYMNPHFKPKTVWWPSQVYNGNPYTDKTASS